MRDATKVKLKRRKKGHPRLAKGSLKGQQRERRSKGRKVERPNEKRGENVSKVSLHGIRGEMLSKCGF